MLPCAGQQCVSPHSLRAIACFRRPPERSCWRQLLRRASGARCVAQANRAHRCCPAGHACASRFLRAPPRCPWQCVQTAPPEGGSGPFPPARAATPFRRQTPPWLAQQTSARLLCREWLRRRGSRTGTRGMSAAGEYKWPRHAHLQLVGAREAAGRDALLQWVGDELPAPVQELLQARATKRLSTSAQNAASKADSEMAAPGARFA